MHLVPAEWASILAGGYGFPNLNGARVAGANLTRIVTAADWFREIEPDRTGVTFSPGYTRTCADLPPIWGGHYQSMTMYQDYVALGYPSFHGATFTGVA